MAETPDEPVQPPDPRERRRVAAGPVAGRERRTGCLLTGAVLGVVVGAIFAFYGLPPILRAIYGETHVAVGATYQGHRKTIYVESVHLAPEPDESGFPDWVVTLKVTTGEAWDTEPADWRLEFGGWDQWFVAEPGDAPEASLRFAGGVERTLVLRFAGSVAFDRLALVFDSPKALHLGDPRVRFDLTGLFDGYAP